MKVTLWQRFLDLVAPRACPVCGQRLAVGEPLMCLSCLLSLPRTGYEKSPYDNHVARLFWGLFPVERATAYCHFHPGSRVANIIYDLKYHDRPDIGTRLGELMARDLQPSGFFDGIDVIIPVPLALRRRRQRGYNQCCQLGLGISGVTGLGVAENVLQRTRFSGSQTRLGPRRRRENVEDAFVLADAEQIRGKHVLLVDDVITTGATLTACARMILTVPDVRVSILAFGLTE